MSIHHHHHHHVYRQLHLRSSNPSSNSPVSQILPVLLTIATLPIITRFVLLIFNLVLYNLSVFERTLNTVYRVVSQRYQLLSKVILEPGVSANRKYAL